MYPCVWWIWSDSIMTSILSFFARQEHNSNTAGKSLNLTILNVKLIVMKMGLNFCIYRGSVTWDGLSNFVYFFAFAWRVTRHSFATSDVSWSSEVHPSIILIWLSPICLIHSSLTNSGLGWVLDTLNSEINKHYKYWFFISYRNIFWIISSAA